VKENVPAFLMKKNSAAPHVVASVIEKLTTLPTVDIKVLLSTTVLVPMYTPSRYVLPPLFGIKILPVNRHLFDSGINADELFQP
jgi:hypothetical protein